MYVFKAAKVKGCEGIAQWSEPIRNHFWHVAEHCKGDAEVLKVKFDSIIVYNIWNASLSILMPHVK